MHPTNVLCKLGVVEYSYRVSYHPRDYFAWQVDPTPIAYLDNLLIGTNRCNYINFYEIICSYETINFENPKQLV
jgi:hypothetical protein